MGNFLRVDISIFWPKIRNLHQKLKYKSDLSFSIGCLFQRLNSDPYTVHVRNKYYTFLEQYILVHFLEHCFGIFLAHSKIFRTCSKNVLSSNILGMFGIFCLGVQNFMSGTLCLFYVRKIMSGGSKWGNFIFWNKHQIEKLRTFLYISFWRKFRIFGQNIEISTLKKFPLL